MPALVCGQTPPVFETDVLPILETNCVACHSGDAPKSELDLSDIQSLVNGGLTGLVVSKGESQQSFLFHLVKRGDMPPQPDKQLSAEDVKVIKDWIDGGLAATSKYTVPELKESITAEQRQHWAFQPLTLVHPDSKSTGNTIIDRYINEPLNRVGLVQSEAADQRTLLRRIYLDLLGVPPSPDAQREFLDDDHPAAYEQLVDRLLSSNQFGMRWGRYWLDVAGYADTVGFDHIPTLIIVANGKWKYRDYVISAFNRDLPYNEFVRQQLAGDELVQWRDIDGYFTPEITDHLVATGFLRTARDQTHESVGVITENYYNVLHDTTEVITSSFLGMTVKCARCHDHKYDAITQQDYYQIQAALMPAYNPEQWRPVYPFNEGGKTVKDRAIPSVSSKRHDEINSHNAQVNARIADLEKSKAELRHRTRERLVDQKTQSAIPEVLREDLKNAVSKSEGDRNVVEKYLVEKLGAIIDVTEDEVTQGLNEDDKKSIAVIDLSVAGEKQKFIEVGRIQALYDIGETPTTFILTRGEFSFPGRPVDAGGLAALSESTERSVLAPAPNPAGSSGRRLALANWLVDGKQRSSALLSRVIVNRIWAHLLGRGIVKTTGDFGVQGAPPTHPEMLDWLALELQRNDWSLKSVIRTIVLSDVYQQSSQVSTKNWTVGYEKDPSNNYYWRMPLRRLESEAVRDSLLSVADSINLEMSGPPVMLKPIADGRIDIDLADLKSPAEQWRRSIYMLSRRGYPYTLLDVFDQPRIETTCNMRQVNAVALQSLTMLNDKFVYQQSEKLAKIVSQGLTDVGKQIEQVYLHALARQPGDEELAACLLLYNDAITSEGRSAHSALTEVCHALFNTSEFLYRE